MNTTFQNSAQVLSIGIFFTLMIVGLAAALPASLFHGLVQHGVPRGRRRRVAAPAAGLDPVRRLPRLQPDAAPARRRGARPRCSPAQAALLTGRRFFPALIAAPFRRGLHAAFDFAIVACLVAAAASWSRGGRYVHEPEPVDRVSRAARAGDRARRRLRRDVGR